jgi:hypothetical protein
MTILQVSWKTKILSRLTHFQSVLTFTIFLTKPSRINQSSSWIMRILGFIELWLSDNYFISFSMVYLLKYPLADVIAQEIYNVKFFKVSSSFLLLFKWLLLIRLPCFPIASQFFIINRFYLDYKGQFLHLFKGLDLFLERYFIIS